MTLFIYDHINLIHIYIIKLLKEYSNYIYWNVVKFVYFTLVTKRKIESWKCEEDIFLANHVVSLSNKLTVLLKKNLLILKCG